MAISSVDTPPRSYERGSDAAADAHGGDTAVRLTASLAARAEANPDYWTFSGNAQRKNGHKLFSYPAMMVPQLQGALLDELLSVDPTVRCVYDPFAGSGTVLVESMLRGLDFVGGDINPLASLIMAVKSRPMHEEKILQASKRISDRIGNDAMPIDVEFRGRDKWFQWDVTQDLCRIRRAVMRERNISLRRFFWVCLAETVRLVSNSRTSTFKLHAYAPEVMESRRPNAITEFKSVVRQNTLQLSQLYGALAEQGLIVDGAYVGSTECNLADVRSSEAWRGSRLADALMTSPPYGDNRTTVPYGQHAFLPLAWIDRRDIGSSHFVEQLMGSPYRTDVASLGGRPGRISAIEKDDLLQKSETLALTAKELADKHGDGERRLIGFFRDLDMGLSSILARLRPGGVMFWTLGERRIAGEKVPTTRVVSELLQARGAKQLALLNRAIPNNAKRMALRNDSVPTMKSEVVLVMQASQDLASS